LVHAFAAGDLPGVGHQRVRAVEQAQLAQLVQLDVVGELDPGLLPGGAAAPEGVLDDPFGERLGDHRDLVGQPGALGDQATLLLPGRGGDPVDHGGDDVDMVVEPGAGLLVGCGQHGLAQHVAVAGQVVAGDQSDRLLHACLAPRLQAERQAGRGGLRGVVAGAVALLGDGQGDHGGEGVGDQTDQGVHVGGGVDLVDDVDDLNLVVLGAAHDQAVLAVLGVQRIGHPRRAAGEGADGPAAGALGGEQGVGAGEVADAQVDQAAFVGGGAAGGRGACGGGGSVGHQDWSSPVPAPADGSLNTSRGCWSGTDTATAAASS